jgi:hypothetical protein
MDLNLDNYSLEELKNILQVPEKEKDFSNMQRCLFTKIDQIKGADSMDLPETKESLIEFYTKVLFKIHDLDNSMKDNPINLALQSFEKTDPLMSHVIPEENKEFISVRDKLLDPLDQTPVVQTNNAFVSRHVDFRPINTFNNSLKAGDINPLTRKSLKRMLNINTKFRNNYTTTQSTNYMLELPSTVKKVVSMRLVESDFPEMAYTVSPKLGSNSFFVDDTYIDISAGSYSSDSIVVAINAALVSAGSSVALSYDDNNGQMTFDNRGANFTLNFAYTNIDCPHLPSNIYKDQLTLGWLLGFRGGYILPITSTQVKYFACMVEKDQQNISFFYEGSSEYTGESLFAPHGAKYFLVSINDFQNNHDSTFISPFQMQTIADNNILAKLLTKCCNKGCVEQPERIYFGPTDIARLEIKIYDEFGRIIDINNADYSLTLELEVIYDL